MCAQIDAAYIIDDDRVGKINWTILCFADGRWEHPKKKGWKKIATRCCDTQNRLLVIPLRLYFLSRAKKRNHVSCLRDALSSSQRIKIHDMILADMGRIEPIEPLFPSFAFSRRRQHLRRLRVIRYQESIFRVCAALISEWKEGNFLYLKIILNDSTKSV